MLRGLILVSVVTASSIALAAEPKSAADALAQKFAGAPESASDAKPSPAAKLPAKPVKAPEPEKKAVVAAEQAVPDRPSLDYEMDMLRRARAERAEQQKPTAPLTNAPAAPAPVSTPATAPSSAGKIVVTPPAAPASPTPAASKVATTTTAPAAAAPAAPATPAASVAPTPSTPVAAAAKVVEATPQVATPAVPTTTAAGSAPVASPSVAPSTPAPAPAKVVEAAPKAATSSPAVQAKADTPVADPKTAAPAAATPAAPARPAAQASLLLAIETGGASSKSGNAQDFDPIICLADTCFISNGLSGDAITLGKADALKLKSTKDASQAACQGMVGCVFRNVGIPSGAQIQVVDLGAPSTEPGQTYIAQLDKTCATNENELVCENPIATPDFRIWIVPEEAAKTAGTEAIEDAVADGLPHRDIARDTDK